MPTGRVAEAVQQFELALQEDPLNPTMIVTRGVALVAAGRDEEASRRFREMLELDPGMAPANACLAIQHLLRGELDQARALMEKAYAATPLVPNAIGGMAGVLSRTGDTARAEELIQKLHPGDAYGTPRALAVYHWMRGDLDASADWMEKAADQHDPGILGMLRYWYGRELRSTPRGPG